MDRDQHDSNAYKAVHSRLPSLPEIEPPTWKGAFAAVTLTAATTLFCILVHSFLEPSNLIMFYLLAVAWSGSKLGRSESVLTSVLSVLAFDFFFVPPYWTFNVHDMQYLVTFCVMLIIALLIGTLTMQLKAQAELVKRREGHTAALYNLSKSLASAVSISQIALIVKDKSTEIFGCDGVLFAPSAKRILEVPLPSASRFEERRSEFSVAVWVAEHQKPAGAGTDTLSESSARYLPVISKTPLKAVFGICCSNQSWQQSYESLLDAFVTQISSALERVIAEQEATAVQVEVESERVRNVLLSSISHDFRSPLAAITGAADTLEERFAPESRQGKELIRSIKTEASRLSRLVRNVLDLTRLEAGKMRLKKEWESIEELIGTAIESTVSLLDTREVEIDLMPNLPLIQVDASAMEQVFVNLLENIAKHTPPKTKVVISARVEGQYLLVEIADSGPGLPAGKEFQVFEKAFRGSDVEQGFGLGLTICQAVIHEHQGSISASNIATGGARFAVKLPLPEHQPEVANGG